MPVAPAFIPSSPQALGKSALSDLDRRVSQQERTGGRIGVVRGTVFETDAANPKVRLDSTGLFATDASGNKLVQVKSDGTGLNLRGGGSSGNNLTWLDDATGVSTVARVTGTGTSAAGVAQLGAKAGTDSASTFPSRLSVNSGTSTDAENLVAASAYNAARAVTTERIIIDGLGQSDFLQLATLGKKRVKWGTDTINFPAAAAATAKDIAHGLGVTPEAVFLTVIAGAALGGVTLDWDQAASGATNFRVRGGSTVALNQNVNIAWLAFG